VPESWHSRHTGLNILRIAARSPSPLPKTDHHIASGLGNHASERSTYFYAYHYVDAVPSLQPSPASGTLTSPWAHDASGLSAPTSNFMCLREYSDGTNPFISAKAVQLTTQYHAAGKLCSSSAAYRHRYCGYLSGFVYLCFCVLIYYPISEIFVLTTAFLCPQRLFATFVRNAIDLVSLTSEWHSDNR